MKKRLMLGALLVLLIIFSINVAAMQCPAGTHTFSGGTTASDIALCIPDVTKAGPVKVQPVTPDTVDVTTVDTTGQTPSECRWGNEVNNPKCKQTTKTAPTDTTTTSGGSLPNPKSISAFSNEDLDQEKIDGYNLIKDVDTVKQKVSNLVRSAIGKYSSEIYDQISKIESDADAVYSRE